MNWREMLDNPIAWGLILSLVVAIGIAGLNLAGQHQGLNDPDHNSMTSAMVWGIMAWVIKDLYFRKK